MRHLREVPDFPEYKIARDGSLYSVRKKKFVKPRLTGGYKPYPRYVLWRNGKRYLKWVHRIVAEVWVAPCEKLKVHHKDGNPANFHADNLRPMTLKEHVEIHKRLRAIQRRKEYEELKKDCPF